VYTGSLGDLHCERVRSRTPSQIALTEQRACIRADTARSTHSSVEMVPPPDAEERAAREGFRITLLLFIVSVAVLGNWLSVLRPLAPPAWETRHSSGPGQRALSEAAARAHARPLRAAARWRSEAACCFPGARPVWSGGAEVGSSEKSLKGPKPSGAVGFRLCCCCCCCCCFSEDTTKKHRCVCFQSIHALNPSSSYEIHKQSIFHLPSAPAGISLCVCKKANGPRPRS